MKNYYFETYLNFTTGQKLQQAQKANVIKLTLCHGSLQLLLSGIEVVDIGLVVLLVVEDHDLLADDWLKTIVGVGQVGKAVLGHLKVKKYTYAGTYYKSVVQLIEELNYCRNRECYPVLKCIHASKTFLGMQ